MLSGAKNVLDCIRMRKVIRMLNMNGIKRCQLLHVNILMVGFPVM